MLIIYNRNNTWQLIWVHSFFKYIPPLVHLLVMLGLTKAKVINAIFGGQKSDFLLRLGCYKTLNTFLNILIFSFNISSGTQNMRWFWNQSIAHEAKCWMKISHLDQTWVPASKYFFWVCDENNTYSMNKVWWTKLHLLGLWNFKLPKLIACLISASFLVLRSPYTMQIQCRSNIFLKGQ